MDRRGNRRFVAQIAHNEGWDQAAERWRLRTLARAVHQADGRVAWDVVDGDLDAIRPLLALDRMSLGGSVAYQQNDPAHLFKRAALAIDQHNWAEAVHLLSKLLPAAPHDERVRGQLLFALERLEEGPVLRRQADDLLRDLAQQINAQEWEVAIDLAQQIEQDPGLFTFARSNPGYAPAVAAVRQSQQAISRCRAILSAAAEMAATELPWREFERVENSLAQQDGDFLPLLWRQKVRAARRTLLQRLIATAPTINKPYFRQRLATLPLEQQP
jgi:hypothetical protein